MVKGWHLDSVRHSNAKRMGKAGPMYKTRVGIDAKHEILRLKIKLPKNPKEKAEAIKDMTRVPINLIGQIDAGDWVVWNIKTPNKGKIIQGNKVVNVNFKTGNID